MLFRCELGDHELSRVLMRGFPLLKRTLIYWFAMTILVTSGEFAVQYWRAGRAAYGLPFAYYERSSAAPPPGMTATRADFSIEALATDLATYLVIAFVVASIVDRRARRLGQDHGESTAAR